MRLFLFVGGQEGSESVFGASLERNVLDLITQSFLFKFYIFLSINPKKNFKKFSSVNLRGIKASQEEFSNSFHGYFFKRLPGQRIKGTFMKLLREKSTSVEWTSPEEIFFSFLSLFFPLQSFESASRGGGQNFSASHLVYELLVHSHASAQFFSLSLMQMNELHTKGKCEKGFVGRRLEIFVFMIRVEKFLIKIADIGVNNVPLVRDSGDGNWWACEGSVVKVRVVGKGWILEW